MPNASMVTLVMDMSENDTSTNGIEQCDRCGETHGNCQDGLGGETVCPNCIRKEAARRHAEQKEQKRRLNVKKERGRWYEQ